MFELEVMTPTRIVDVVVLSQKNRAPDEDPGAKLTLSVDVSNDALSMFDGRWLHALYTRNGADAGDAEEQIPLDGVVPVSEAPDLTNIGQHVPRIAWSELCNGYTLEMDFGARERVVLAGCTCSGWRIFPKAGGTITVKFNVESNDVSETAFGRLAKHKSREVRATLMQTGASDAQQDVEDEPEARPKRAARSLKTKMARAAASAS